MNLLDPSFLNPLAASRQDVKTALEKLPDKIKADLTKINAFLKQKKIDIFECFDKMDVDGDGTISKREFIDVLMKEYLIPELTKERIGQVFDAIDRNRTGDLSIGEMLMYLEGSQKSVLERKQTTINNDTVKQMEYEIDYLFNELTGGKSDFLNEVTLHQALKAANIHMDRLEVKKIIETYD